MDWNAQVSCSFATREALFNFVPGKIWTKAFVKMNKHALWTYFQGPPLGSGNQQDKSGCEGVRRLVSGKKQKNEFSNDSELEFM